MDIEQLRYFLSLTQILNFSESARRCGVSQSTMSRRIGDLEAQLDAQLFTRTKREVSLTAEGRAFLPYAREIVEASEKAQSVISQLKGGGAGRISIVCGETADPFLTKCLARFNKNYPDVITDISVMSGSARLEALQDPSYDFHFIYRDMLPEAGNMDYIITGADTLSIAAPNNTDIKSLSDIQDARFSLLSESADPILYMEIIDVFRAFHFEPKIVSRPDSVKSVLLSVASGSALSVLPTATLENERSVVSIPLDELDTSILRAVAWQQSNVNPAARLFGDIVRENAAECGIIEDML